MNAILYGKKKHLRTELQSYSDDVFEQVPFVLDAATAALSDDEVRNRIVGAVQKRFRARNGYACSVESFTRNTSLAGYVVLKHYNGIGD